MISTEYKPTDEQASILSHDTSLSGRILAGPGTGKSATVVALLKQLSAEHCTPVRIKLLTFTRAATAELAKKVDGNTILRPSTIHSFAISVLLQNPGTAGFPEPLRISDNWEHRYIVLETLKRLTNFTVKQLREFESKMAANWESLSSDSDLNVSAEDRARYQGAWQEHRRIYG